MTISNNKHIRQNIVKGLQTQKGSPIQKSKIPSCKKRGRFSLFSKLANSRLAKGIALTSLKAMDKLFYPIKFSCAKIKFAASKFTLNKKNEHSKTNKDNSNDCFIVY